MKCSDELTWLVIDPKAETLEEIRDAAGIKRWMANQIANRRVKEGRWEKVLKYNGSRLVSAYRVKK